MPYYRAMGDIPPKRHTQFRQADGRLYHEELMGTEGFSNDQSLLYHAAPPTQVLHVERLPDAPHAAPQWEVDAPLRHRLLKTAEIPPGGDAVSARIPLLGNSQLLISVARPTDAMDYFYRFGQGDELLFVHEGTGELQTQFGVIHYRPGDYLVLPIGTVWKLLPDVGVEQRLLVVEAMGHIRPPRRYLSPHGQFLEHAPYCERDLRPPERLITHRETGEFELRVKSRGAVTRLIYAHHPFDVVGWDGCLWPYAFSIHDFEPITGRVHQPPPVHQTFEGPGFVVCSFVPRLFDYHPLAIPAPYNHSNTDSDEVLYYVEGEFMSRKGIEPAALTVHPAGIPHGPHPGTYEGSIGKPSTAELAVMIDTFRPLGFTQQATRWEDPDYYRSWTLPREE